MMKRFTDLKEQKMKGEDPCWKGYEMVGMKDKAGKKVPNCVPVKEQTDTLEKNEMAQTQLHFIKYAAEEILEYIEMGGEIEEWYQNKLSKVQSEVESLHSYVEGESRRTGMKEEVSEQNLPGQFSSGAAKKPYKPAPQATPANEQEDKMSRYMPEQKPPFDGPYTKAKGTVTDKSGAKHSPMSRARDLARDAMKKVSAGLPKKKLDESRKAEIVKQASKDAKKKSKVSDDKFQSEPTLASDIIKSD
jgi:hypothetical protein